jgi:hypothetical protein
MAMAYVLLLVLSVVVTLLSGCGVGHSCTLIGCTSSATFTLASSLPADVTVRLCRENVCSEGAVAANKQNVDLPGSLHVEVDNALPQIEIRFSGTWTASRDAFQDDLKDGETIAVKVTGPAGVLAETKKKMTYTHDNPNGPGCGPDCKTATIAL